MQKGAVYTQNRTKTIDPALNGKISTNKDALEKGIRTATTSGWHPHLHLCTFGTEELQGAINVLKVIRLEGILGNLYHVA